MRLGFIAMSGVRAWDERLNRAGLTMPGVVERGRVIASMPTLSLLTLAALTPPDVEVEYLEIRDLKADGAPLRDFDLVAIASQSAQIGDAYRVAATFGGRGATVVMGGMHVSALPREALEHCDAVVVGEGEPVWLELIEDFRRGRLRPVYRALRPFDLADAPVPRFELLDYERYNRLLVQTSRGCPHRCEFCAGSILQRDGYGTKPAANIAREVAAIKQVWRRPFIELADDNSFSSRRHAREVCRVLGEAGARWFAETDVSIADDAALLDLMRESGCRQVLMGLESPTECGLGGIERRRDWKLRQACRYERAVHEIQSRGIAVNGCFILGLDGHTPAVFEDVLAFAARTGLFDVQITVQTPFPGTPLYERLLTAGRIIEPGAWHRCTLFDVNFVPTHMTPDELQWGMVDLAQRLFASDAVGRRRERFMDTARARGWATLVDEAA